MGDESESRATPQTVAAAQPLEPSTMPEVDASSTGADVNDDAQSTACSTQPAALFVGAEPTRQDDVNTAELALLMSRLEDKEREIIKLKDLVDTYEQYDAERDSDHKAEVNALVADLTARDEVLAGRKEAIQQLERIAAEKRSDAVTYLRQLLPRIQFERDSLKTIQLLPRISDTLLRTLQTIHDGRHPEGSEKIVGLKRSKCFRCHFSDGQSNQGRLYYRLDESARGRHVVLVTVGADEKQKKDNIEWISRNW
jgi:hypothetical protein